MKGLSSVVAVILLVAIATIGAASLYFWTGGLATKQTTPTAPSAITANPLGDGFVLVANLGSSEVNASTLATAEGNTLRCSSSVISPNTQTRCKVYGSGTVTIYGTGTGTTPIETEGWTHYVPVDITERSGSNLTDYIVNITMDTKSLVTAGKMKSDCSDIRVVGSDGVNYLPYWIEKGTCNTTQTIVWTKVDLIASQTKRIYVDYGKSDAKSKANGKNVFLLFDDFDDSSINQNLWYSQLSNFTISNSSLRINEGALGLKNALPFNLSDGYIVETRCLFNSALSGYSGTIPELSSSRFTAGGNGNSDATVLYMRGNGVSDLAYWMANGSSASYNLGDGVAAASNDDVWYLTGASVQNDTVKLWKDNAVTYQLTGITWAKSMNYTSLGAFNGAATGDIQDTTYDWVRIRQYIPLAPSVAVGAESQ